MTKMEQNNQNNRSMKAKYLVGALVMSVFGALIALLVYTRIIDKPAANIRKEAVNLSIPDTQPMLTSFQQQEGQQVDLTFAAEQTVHGVVHVRTTTTMSGQNNPLMEFFYGDSYSRPRVQKGFGSGVIISADGYIITNNHVVESAEEVNVKLNDNREFKAQVIGRDPNTDVALLKIKAENLPYIKYGDSDGLKLGEWVLAVGNPFNLTSTVTAGIISAKGRNLTFPGEENNSYKIESFIQTDAALNMGNSGGALVNTKGLLVGITSAIVSRTGEYAGNSFAIPVNIVKKVVDDLKQYGEVQRAFMGVNISDVTPDLIEKEDLKLDAVKGVYLTNINAGGAAKDAGLKEKDVIVKFNGASVGSVSELQEQVGRYRPGDKADVTYIRNGKENTVTLTLKNYDNTTKVVAPGEGIGVVLGARLESLNSEDKANYRVDYGVKVTELNSGKFKDLGIRKGDIILSVNGKKVKSASDVKEFTNNGQSLSLLQGYTEGGTEFSFRFNR
jgi:serine protease Do